MSLPSPPLVISITLGQAKPSLLFFAIKAGLEGDKPALILKKEKKRSSALHVLKSHQS